MGLAAGAFLLVFILPLAEHTDYVLLSHPMAPLVTLALTMAALYVYPGSDRWTPARGDTTVILGSYLGVHLGAWTNFQLGILRGPPEQDPPYPILWPTYEQYGHTLLRLAIGGVVFIATRAIVKPLTIMATCRVLGEDRRALAKQPFDIRNKSKIFVDLTQKFVTFFAVGFGVMCVTPIVFEVIGCERSTFYTEV